MNSILFSVMYFAVERVVGFPSLAKSGEKNWSQCTGSALWKPAGEVTEYLFSVENLVLARCISSDFVLPHGSGRDFI